MNKMFKILLRKQFLEMSTPFVLNRKTGKRKTGKQKIGYIVLVIYLFGLLAFNGVNNSQTMISVFGTEDTLWMYFSLMFCLASALGVMLAVIITYTGVFMSKDNDLLLSLPIPVNAIIISRIMNSYIWSFAFTAPGLIPASVIYFIRFGFNAKVLIGSIISLFLAPLFAVDIAALCSWVVGMLTKKTSKKNGVLYALTAIFCIGYSFLNSFIMSTLTSLSFGQVEERFGGLIKGLKIFGRALTGDFIAIGIVLGACLVVTYLFFAVLKRSFTDIVTTKTGEKKRAYSDSMIQTNTPAKSLFKREFNHLLKTGMYLMNTAMGSFMAIICIVLFAIFGGKLSDVIEIAQIDSLFVNIIAACVLLGLSSMNFISAPSYTLEGKTLWIIKSMPVNYSSVLSCKISVHLYVTLVPVLVLFLEGMFFLDLDPKLMLALFFFIYDSAAIGLMIDLKWGSTKFINGTVAVKQNPLVLLAMGINLVMAAVAVVPYFILRNKVTLPQDTYLMAVLIVYILVGFIMKNRVKTHGVELLLEDD